MEYCEGQTKVGIKKSRLIDASSCRIIAVTNRSDAIYASFSSDIKLCTDVKSAFREIRSIDAMLRRIGLHCVTLILQ